MLTLTHDFKEQKHSVSPWAVLNLECVTTSYLQTPSLMLAYTRIQYIMLSLSHISHQDSCLPFYFCSCSYIFYRSYQQGHAQTIWEALVQFIEIKLHSHLIQNPVVRNMLNCVYTIFWGNWIDRNRTTCSIFLYLFAVSSCIYDTVSVFIY